MGHRRARGGAQASNVITPRSRPRDRASPPVERRAHHDRQARAARSAAAPRPADAPSRRDRTPGGPHPGSRGGGNASRSETGVRRRVDAHLQDRFARGARGALRDGARALLTDRAAPRCRAQVRSGGGDRQRELARRRALRGLRKRQGADVRRRVLSAGGFRSTPAPAAVSRDRSVVALEPPGRSSGADDRDRAGRSGGRWSHQRSPPHRADDDPVRSPG